MSITIAIPKGYLFNEAIKKFKAIGMEFGDLSQLKRKLTFSDLSGEFKFLIVRPSDVPVYVEHGAADLGISGRDTLDEGEENVARLIDLGFGYCRLVVAGVVSKGYTMDNLPNIPIVATKFVNSAAKYFRQKGIKAEIIKLYGSIELSPIVGLSDIIVDLVATGDTMRDNGLEEIETIFESTAYLIANKVAFQTKNLVIADIVNKLNNEQ
jgi:ATP phosphoribosyltransferase